MYAVGCLRSLSDRDLVEFLEKKGFKSWGFVPNNKFRKDIQGWQLKVVPYLSLRYVAVASGVGSFGWSGNVGIKGYGTTILLGAVVTEAELEPTGPLPPEDRQAGFHRRCEEPRADARRGRGGPPNHVGLPRGPYRHPHGRTPHLGSAEGTIHQQR